MDAERRQECNLQHHTFLSEISGHQWGYLGALKTSIVRENLGQYFTLALNDGEKQCEPQKLCTYEKCYQHDKTGQKKEWGS